MKMFRLSTLLALSFSELSLANEYGQWGVYVYSDRNCEHQLGQWRDDQLQECISLDGYPDALSVRTDIKNLGPVKCGWNVMTFDNPTCSGVGRDIRLSDVCVDTPFLGDFKKPVKSFIVGEFPLCD
ncbi:uncharacterized protein FTJAE_10130 [Fusarium tjaetaba]|uniref:Uncharacterized protein n=1 Tax=Fusarium tjaetaba TaxID=1567544 RepID=A0A8H5VKY9_9HYPO|nr:uncharacterized protein FTJAE_10130 [Fusarium tjaetaba]KAF5624784.1 hypothetical protein FTJAE_10130 [Fusarium tjaetaba]